MTGTEILEFAERYAAFKAELLGDAGALSRRGMAAALEVVLGQLLDGQEPAGAVAAAIDAYRAAEVAERQDAEDAERRLLAIGCRSCGAPPGEACQAPNARTAKRPHRYRRDRAGRQPRGTP
jgi:hypothetical protein